MGRNATIQTRPDTEHEFFSSIGNETDVEEQKKTEVRLTDRMLLFADNKLGSQYLRKKKL